MTAANMEDKLLGVGLMGCMAVDTHARHLCILNDGILIEVGQVALIETHLTEHLIARCNATVGKSPFIKGIFTDRHREILILRPLSILQYADSKGKLSTLVLLRQCMPVGYVESSLITLDMQFAAFTALHHYIQVINIIFNPVEVQRSNLCRNGYTGIIGIDLWQLVHLGGVDHLTGAASKKGYR